MFHLTTVEPATYSLLQEIFRIDAINKQFALAGGTSLSLQIGHRQSVDLDIFSVEAFNPKEIEIILSENPNISFTYTGNNSRMLFGYANNIKCDFVQEPAVLLQPFIIHEGITFFHIQDIAAMKMHTICGRGKKKDFLTSMPYYSYTTGKKCWNGLERSMEIINITFSGKVLAISPMPMQTRILKV